MITKQNIKEAAKKYAAESISNCAGSFVDGVQWALQTLEPMHNEAANQLEQFRNVVRIPGTDTYFDWRDIDEEYNWVAVDGNGSLYKYTDAPIPVFGGWGVTSGCGSIHLYLVGSVFPNWRELIFERPK